MAENLGQLNAWLNKLQQEVSHLERSIVGLAIEVKALHQINAQQTEAITALTDAIRQLSARVAPSTGG